MVRIINYNGDGFTKFRTAAERAKTNLKEKKDKSIEFGKR